MGLAVIIPAFEPPLAQLSWLHVSRPHRRRGAASALWQRAVELSRAAGATAMYVSATPTSSAVGFYLQQGCRLADPPHPDLFALEPDDIHLVLDLD
jgi:predicted N-acetyltransferase YhbS